MTQPLDDAALDALVAAAFAADTPAPPASAGLIAGALAHARERPPGAGLGGGRGARIGWAAAGIVALVLGCAAGAASRMGAVPNDLDAAFGVAQSGGDANAG